MAGKKVNCKQIKEDIAIAAPRPQIFADAFEKHANILFVQYKPGVNPDEVLQKMIPIGLEWKTEGYQYTEKYVKQYVLQLLRITDLFMPVFLCRYIGLVFLLICAALLSLKQSTENADNIYRYGLPQKLGADIRTFPFNLLSLNQAQTAKETETVKTCSRKLISSTLPPILRKSSDTIYSPSPVFPFERDSSTV